MKLKLVALACVVWLAAIMSQAQAVTYTYVGSWTVDGQWQLAGGSWQPSTAPSWDAAPPAYTGQEAAQLLFGGNASDYAISTLGIDPGVDGSNLNFSNWVSVYFGIPSAQIVAQDFKVGPLYADIDDTSAYVDDPSGAEGDTYVNYAFRVSDVGGPGTEAPIPAVGAGVPGLILIGGAALKWMRRRRRNVAA